MQTLPDAAHCYCSCPWSIPPLCITWIISTVDLVVLRMCFPSWLCVLSPQLDFMHFFCQEFCLLFLGHSLSSFHCPQPQSYIYACLYTALCMLVVFQMLMTDCSFPISKCNRFPNIEEISWNQALVVQLISYVELKTFWNTKFWNIYLIPSRITTLN